MISQGNVNVGPQGLKLHAWALCDGAGLIASSNIATFVTNGQNKDITFIVAAPNTRYFVYPRIYKYSAGMLTAYYTSVTVNGFQLGHLQVNGGASVSFDLCHFEVYIA